MNQNNRSVSQEINLANNKKGRFISILFFLIVVILAIGLIPWQETWRVLTSTDLIILALAYSLTIPNQLFVALSYYIVINSQKLDIDYGKILRLNIVMIFYDVVLPWSILVSGLRWHRYNEYSGKPGKTITSIAYLKIFDIWITLLFSFGFIFLFSSSTIERQTPSIIALILLISLVLYLTPTISEFIQKKLPPPGDHCESTNNSVCRQICILLQALSNFRNLTFKHQFSLIILGVLSQIIHYLGYILFAESVGINLTLSQLGAVRAVILIATNVPVNLGVGVSLREVSLVSLLAALNVPLEKAVALSIVMLSKSLFFGAVGGLIEGFQFIQGRKIN